MASRRDQGPLRLIRQEIAGLEADKAAFEAASRELANDAVTISERAAQAYRDIIRLRDAERILVLAGYIVEE